MVVVTRCCGGGWIFVVVDTGSVSWCGQTARRDLPSSHARLSLTRAVWPPTALQGVHGQPLRLHGPLLGKPANTLVELVVRAVHSPVGHGLRVVTSVGHHLHHSADVNGSIGGPERVDHADPSCIGLAGAHSLEACGATGEVGRVWRVGDVLVAGALVVAVALQKNAPRRRRRCPRPAWSSLACPEAPHVRDKRSRVRRLLEEAGRPHARGLPVLALALLRDFHGVVQGLDGELQIAVHRMPLFGAPGLRYIEFVDEDMATFVFGEGRTEP